MKWSHKAVSITVRSASRGKSGECTDCHTQASGDQTDPLPPFIICYIKVEESLLQCHWLQKGGKNQVGFKVSQATNILTTSVNDTTGMLMFSLE